MRLWLRVVVTLVLAPLIWQAAAIYLGANQGGDPGDLATKSLLLLPSLYLTYTLPALAIVALLLVPLDRLLALVGADLLVVGAAPIVAMLVPTLLGFVIHDPRLHAAGIATLAFVYGLVFGLTVREPRATPTPFKDRPA